jgi:hypothetical protein
VTEAQFQRAVIELAEFYRWKVAHFADSRRQVRPGVFVGDRQAAGFPDLTLCHNAHGVVFLELKSDTGRLRAEQIEWIHALRAAGCRAWVARPSDWGWLAEFLKTGGAPPLAAGEGEQTVAARPAAPPPPPPGLGVNVETGSRNSSEVSA